MWNSAELRNYVISRLNAILAADPEALTALVKLHVPCDERVTREHVQVGDTPEGLRMGLMGVINALTGVIEEEGPHKDWGPICAVMERDGTISSFQATATFMSRRFVVVDPAAPQLSESDRLIIAERRLDSARSLLPELDLECTCTDDDHTYICPACHLKGILE